MAKVFVSYASPDLALAAKLHEWLEADGHEVFLDRDPRTGIAVGDEWVRRLHERLRWANALLCVITTDYLASAWCTAELDTARMLGSRILPLRPGTVVHPLLDEIQHTDLADPAKARARIARALREIDAAGDPHWPDGRSPFPGLVPLDVDRHRVFFGRDREVAELVGLVQEDNGGTLVVGPSGCGKSSLVRAGLIPAMTGVPGVFPLPVVMPGHDPVSALDHVLAQTPSHRPLLVIDQLEEVFTLSDVHRRREFAGRLRDTDAHLVCTIRPEYLTELLSDPHLADLCGRVHPVTPLRRESLREIIERPAEIAGIAIDEHLTSRLIDDTGDGTALPLLAFTLAELSDGVRRGGRLSSARYDALGGVRGALLAQSDAALLAATTGRTAPDVLAALLSLVTVDERGRPTRRHVPGISFPELAEFVTRRLVTTDTIAGEVVLGVAHEAFLTEWPPLAEAITEHAAALRTRGALEQAATEWTAAGRPPSRLWQGAHLHVAREDVTRVDLSATADDFLHASVRHDRHRRRRTVTVLSVLLVIALAGAAIAYNRQLIAQDRQSEAEQRQRAAVAQQLITQAGTFTSVAPWAALALGVAAGRIAPGNASANAVVRHTLANSGYRGALPGQTRVVHARRARLLAGVGTDGSVTVWSTSAPGPPRLKHRLAVDGMGLRQVAISPDGRTLATANSSGEILVWDLTATTPHRIGPVLSGEFQPITDMAFTNDGTTLVTANRHDARLWNISDPTRTHLLGWYLHHDGASEINAVAFSPGGELLAAGESLWDVTRSEQPRPAGRLPVGTAPLRDVAFSPVRGLAAVSGDDGVVLVDVSDPDHPRAVSARLAGSESTKSLDFSPDGRTLAITGGLGGTAMWDVTDPLAPRRVADTPPAITAGSVSFSPDGHSLAVENTLWDLTGKFRPAPIGEPFDADVRSLAFSPDGTTLAVGGDDRVTLWRPHDPATPFGEPLTGISPHEPTAVTFAPDGRVLAAGNTFQDVTDPGHPRKKHQLEYWTVLTVFSPDGNYFLTTTAGDTGNVPTLWSSRDPARRDRFLRGHDTKVAAAAISPDSRKIATVSTDGSVRGWDFLAPGSVPDPMVGNVSGAAAVAFSPDSGVLVAGGSGGTALVWDTQGVSRVGQPMPVAAAQLAFAPHGRLLATGSPDGTVLLWDMTDPFTPRQLGPPLRFRARGPLAFSPDGTTLATGDVSDGVRLWDLRPLTSMLDKPFEIACEILGEGLAEQEWPQLVPGLPYRETCP
ncbi:hypothetical protein UK23_08295 [Lentzea aerocolonigenes]|uniref:TIR domain-containing protein n=1 Tax=Lentzea aerocolonigenes TaxID=68170 RepID=A0A0F0H9V1_LENAE|nr:TIR domain-containing protein [Lentzea aerocolonigenes]KJK51112.1 hypothetical protein UK23_08295 [Lentzea aerocolonigenes]